MALFINLVLVSFVDSIQYWDNNDTARFLILTRKTESTIHHLLELEENLKETIQSIMISYKKDKKPTLPVFPHLSIQAYQDRERENVFFEFTVEIKNVENKEDDNLYYEDKNKTQDTKNRVHFRF